MPNKVETIQEKTYRIASGLLISDGEEPLTFEESKSDSTFKHVVRLVAIAQAEALEEAAKLHSFGEGIVYKGSLLGMARNLRESVK